MIPRRGLCSRLPRLRGRRGAPAVSEEGEDDSDLPAGEKTDGRAVPLFPGGIRRQIRDFEEGKE